MRMSLSNKLIALLMILVAASIFTGLQFRVSLAMADHQMETESEDCIDDHHCSKEQADCLEHCVSQVFNQNLSQEVVMTGGINLVPPVIDSETLFIPQLESLQEDLLFLLPRPDPLIILTTQKRE